MPQLIKNECKKMFLPVLLTTAALTIIMCVLIEKLYLSYTLHYDLEAWEVGTGAVSYTHLTAIII